MVFSIHTQSRLTLENPKIFNKFIKEIQIYDKIKSSVKDLKDTSNLNNT